MKQQIEDIYKKNLGLIKESEWAVHYFRIQNLDTALRKTVIVLDRLTELLPLYIQENQYFNEDRVRYTEEGLMGICRLLLEAQESKDYVLLADYYELYLLPLLYDLQERVAIEEGGIPRQFNKEAYKEFQAEYTGCGALTLRAEKLGGARYLHSNKSPYKEALELALSWYQEDKEEYVIYGLGLGYHIAALGEIDKSISIFVYESDKQIIELFQNYGEVEAIKNNSNIHIYYDKDLKQLLEKIESMNEEEELVIHQPSLELLSPSPVKEWLEEYFIQYSSLQSQGKILNGNFRRNIKENASCIDELKENFIGKTIYLVGAGPSLDKNFMKLKHISKESIILSTGTAFRKLLSNGIRPDFVMETDANERIRGHFWNMEEETVPMLLLSTAAHIFMEIYTGKKYLIFQKDFPKAEAYANTKGYTLYETGGSVMTLALDVGIRMGCKKIVFLGLDLAYTDNYAHASGTSRREIPKENTGLQQVEDINGNMVATNRSFSLYRKWIERRIAREKNSGIRFIDATEGGAKVRGTEIMSLKDVLNEEGKA